MDILDQLSQHYTPQETVKVLADLAGYWRMPPTIDEFLDDPYYAGNFLGPYMYPAWRAILRQIYPHPLYSPYVEIAFTGCIGSGKSTVCLAGMLYDLCRLLCLRDIHDTYQLISSTQIVVAFMNTTLKLADSVLFNQFKEWIEMSPFFQEMRQKANDPKRELLPNNIGMVVGSRGGHALGRAVFQGILSELNFQGQAKKDQAYQSYVQVRRRMESRFMRGAGYIIPGRLWLDSSKSDELGFLEQHLKKMDKDKENSLVVCKAVWEVLDCKINYCGETFDVFMGDATRDPYILSGPTPFLGIPENLIIRVPIEYRKSFEQDIYGALRDIAGVSTWSAHKFFPQMVQYRSRAVLPNACPDIITLDFRDGSRLIDMVDLSLLDKNSVWFPHFDLGLKIDRTGLAMTRCLGEAAISRFSPTTLSDLVTRDLVFETNLATAIIPSPGQEVPIYKLKNFVVDLIEAGYQIGGVSADGYQSANLLQDFKLLNLPVEVISVDRSRDGYDLWKQAALESRWAGASNSLLEREVENLQDLGKKIDHPETENIGFTNEERPSKDVADAVAGSTFHCWQKSARISQFVALESYTNAMQQALKQPITVQEELIKLQLEQKRRFLR